MSAIVWTEPQRKIRTITKPTIVRAESGHTMYVAPIAREDAPAHIRDSAYTTFYTVQNFDASGVQFMYLGKGYRHPSPEYANDPKAHDPKEIVAWYMNGEMWHGRGEDFAEAINGAQRDGWLATRPR